jgi:hypothetical protein
MLRHIIGLAGACCCTGGTGGIAGTGAVGGVAAQPVRVAATATATPMENNLFTSNSPKSLLILLLTDRGPRFTQ